MAEYGMNILCILPLRSHSEEYACNYFDIKIFWGKVMKFLSRKFIISVLSLVCMIIFFVLKYISEISFVILYSVLMIVYLVVEGVLDLKKQL